MCEVEDDLIRITIFCEIQTSEQRPRLNPSLHYITALLDSRHQNNLQSLSTLMSWCDLVYISAQLNTVCRIGHANHDFTSTTASIALFQHILDDHLTLLFDPITTH